VFDKVYTSVLMRAIRTAWILLEGMDLTWLHLRRNWRETHDTLPISTVRMNILFRDYQRTIRTFFYPFIHRVVAGSK
jgi:bisphosphoglycerate-dependent phosphoglycerate mutase